ncbi:hypothetical protein N9R04_00560 [Staphylococcus sp. SQ8-PEA]|uniref:Uncharacterized protein n=2 Tax=Staphylococcus marylandisciuri TaxID=2981529 RepID=A0ABT2QML1_9STAP|nr:hypothetical protein [Staphylococcus marylandisciuri]MCU5745211.1 hypothetical protein [Staphylococcus marylandisciuri]
MAIVSNVFLVIGIILLIMLKLVMAITMFVVSLAISLVMFNVFFRERTGMKWAINISFILVLVAVMIAYFVLK